MNSTKTCNKQLKSVNFSDKVQQFELTKQPYNRDPFEIDYINFKVLYNQMKKKGINQRFIKKAGYKYEQNVLSLLSETYNHKFNPKSSSIKYKIIDFNQQLKIRITQIYDYLTMIQLGDIRMTLQTVVNSILLTNEKLMIWIQNQKKNKFKLQTQIQQKQANKRNTIMCSICKQHLQIIRLQNLKDLINTTTTEVRLSSLEQQHKRQSDLLKVKHFSLLQDIQRMSDQSFFNIQSEDFIKLINHMLKSKTVLYERTTQKQTTVNFLKQCLNQMSKLQTDTQNQILPLAIDSLKLVRTNKAIISGKINPLNDLTQKEIYNNKMKQQFTQPIRKFIKKYQHLFEVNHIKKQAMIEKVDVECQTSLQKQNQIVKNLQKSIFFLNSQLSAIRQSKQKNQKQLIKSIDNLQLNELKMTQLLLRNTLLQNQNRQLSAQINKLNSNIRQQKKCWQSQKTLIFQQSSDEKSQLMKNISELSKKIQQMQSQNLTRILKLKMTTNQTQTYICSFLQSFNKQFIEVQVQTEQDQSKKSKKNDNMQKSIKKYSKNNFFNNRNQSILSDMFRSQGIFNKKSNHIKSRSQLPLCIDANLIIGQKDEANNNQSNQGQSNAFSSTYTIQIHNQSNNKIKNNQLNKLIVENVRNTSISNFISQINSYKSQQQIVINQKTNNQKKNLQQNLINSQLKKNKIPILAFSSINIQHKDKNISSRERLDLNSIQKRNTTNLSKTHRRYMSGNLQIDSNLKYLQVTQKDDNKLIMKKLPKQKLLALSVRKNPFQTKNNQQKQVQYNNQCQLIKYKACQNKEIGIQYQTFELTTQRQTNKSKQKIQKQTINQQHMFRIVKQKYQYLDKVGLVQLFNQIPYSINLQISQSNIQTIGKSINKVRKNIQLEKKKVQQYHIKKSNIQIFFSFQEANRFQSRQGLWSDDQPDLMLGNNLSKSNNQINAFIDYLYTKNRHIYNQMALFIDKPATFIKEILDGRDIQYQGQKISKKAAQGKVVNPTLLKQMVKKIINMHKTHHKNCNHMQLFLQQIGFKQFNAYQSGCLSKKFKQQIQKQNINQKYLSKKFKGKKFRKFSPSR